MGFTYGLDSSGRSALRGGFGVFYQRTPYAFLNTIFSNTVYSNSFLILSPSNRVDPGPSQGSFPTDPFLVNGPTVNRDLLNQRYPPGTIIKNTGEVFFDNTQRKLAQARQYSIGYQRELRTDLAVSVDYIHTEQRGLFLRSNLNPGLRTSTSRTGTVVRVDPNFVTNVWQEETQGFFDYNALQVEVDKRFRRGFSVRGAYTWSRGRGNSDVGNNEIIDTQLLGDLRLDQMEGPTSIDRPHALSISGTVDVPGTKGLKVSGVLQARSGTRFSLIDSNFDLDRNGNFNNEWLPPGSYSGTGRDAITVDYDGGRRGARGPGYFRTDLRAQYRFRLGGPRNLDLMFDVFNLTNRANFTNPLGDRRNATTFLVVTSLVDGGPTRTMQLNARFTF